MSEPSNLEQVGTLAAGGCAVGIVGTLFSGEADLTEAKGWGRLLLGCVGNAAGSVGSYYLVDHFTKDPDLAKNFVYATWGFQSAASFTNWLGHRNGWEDKPLFNAIALPLNLGSAPLSSSLGLSWALVGEIGSGFQGRISVYGGQIAFDHKLCFAPVTLGSVGNCFHTSNQHDAQHELGHVVQYSAMGDGFLGIFVTDMVLGTFVISPLYAFQFPGALLLEPGADDYGKGFKQ